MTDTIDTRTVAERISDLIERIYVTDYKMPRWTPDLSPIRSAAPVVVDEPEPVRPAPRVTSRSRARAAA